MLYVFFDVIEGFIDAVNVFVVHDLAGSVLFFECFDEICNCKFNDFLVLSGILIFQNILLPAAFWEEINN